MVTHMAQKVSKKTPDTATKLVDELLSQVDQSEILAKDGLFSKLKNNQQKEFYKANQSTNQDMISTVKKRRNGSYNKTIIDNEGNKAAIEVPRDRERI